MKFKDYIKENKSRTIIKDAIKIATNYAENNDNLKRLWYDNKVKMKSTLNVSSVALKDGLMTVSNGRIDPSKTDSQRIFAISFPGRGSESNFFMSEDEYLDFKQEVKF